MTRLSVNVDFVSELHDLGRWLEVHRSLWSQRPFIGLPVSWEADEPEVAAALRRLPLEVVEAWESRPMALPDPPSAFLRWASEAERWSKGPSLLDEAASSRVIARSPLHVPGRKWHQIQPFTDVARRYRPPSVDRWIDWCSGKGHLGRTLAQATSLPFTGVERDEALCRAGVDLAVGQGVEGRFLLADVLEEDLVSELSPGSGVVALHACGGLHEGLLRSADAGGASFLVVAPCCYHRHPSSSPRPMSEAAAEVGLDLEPGHLRLVGLREVVASPRRAELRRREQAFRLGLDELVRTATGTDRYQPLGPTRRTWADLSFEEFCRRLSSRAKVELPVEIDWSAAEAGAWERLRIVRALALVRGLFRIPLETWLLLDRAQFLVERGWTVQCGTFCDEATTPRNGAIVAWR